MKRLSGDLFEYMAEVDEDEIPELPDMVPEHGTEPLPEVPDEEGGDRNLWVFSPDTRYEMQTQGMATYWPQRLNGKVDSGCTGTIISRDAVLTAGHCVWNSNTGNWMDLDFTPAQYRTSSNQLQAPYGKYSWRYVTTYYAWTRYGNWDYDMAVVRYWPKNDVNIGDRLGYAGLRGTDSYSSHLDQSYNTGYPSDKGGQEMWKSYCGAVFWHNDQKFYSVDHTCDITYGNSGGSFIGWDGYVYAIQSNHQLNGSYNTAVLLNGMHFSNALKWAGRA